MRFGPDLRPSVSSTPGNLDAFAKGSRGLRLGKAVELRAESFSPSEALGLVAGCHWQVRRPREARRREAQVISAWPRA